VAKQVKSSRVIALVLAFGALLAGCGPEKVLQWSPDGKQAAVTSKGTLYICDATGALSKPLASDVERVAWYPDSRRMAVVFRHEVQAWEELGRAAAAGFEPEKIKTAARIAREELLRYTGKLDDFRPSNAADLTAEQWVVALFYLRLEADPRLAEKLGDQWQELETLKVEIHEVHTLRAPWHNPADGDVLYATLSPIEEVRVSPDGGALAIVESRMTGWADTTEYTLKAMIPHPNQRPVLVDPDVAAFPDWSADSRELIFMRDAGSSSGSAASGRLTRRVVRDPNGAFPGDLPQPRDLVSLPFQDTLKLRRMKDGSILFAAKATSLTDPNGPPSGKPALFLLKEGKHTTPERLWPPSRDGMFPDRADLFEISPDETRVSLPGEDGRVCILSLENREVTVVVERNPAGLKAVPVWRKDGYLSLVMPKGSALGSSGRDEIVLWKPRKHRVLSRNWPDEVLAGIR